MPRTILSIAYPFAPVSPGAVGGAEQVLSALDSSLAAHGYRSIVVASQGSEVAGHLYEVALPQTASISDSDRSWARKRFQAAIDRAIGAEKIDAIHMHGLDFADYVLPRNIPVIATLHLPISWYGESLFNANARQAYLCCVSQTQRESCPRELGSVTVIENGVEIPSSLPQTPRGDFALVMGRICPEKNPHQALEAGTLADTPVYVAGQLFPYAEHQRYFAEKLQPFFSNPTSPLSHRFLGPVDPSERLDLLVRAKCLLHPTLAPETSSLVAMEALAAGTPVIAYRSGALQEIVTEGVTGFLVNSPQSMSDAIRRVDLIPRDACRQQASRRFSRSRMIHDYLQLYDHLIAESATGRRYA